MKLYCVCLRVKFAGLIIKKLWSLGKNMPVCLCFCSSCSSCIVSWWQIMTVFHNQNKVRSEWKRFTGGDKVPCLFLTCSWKLFHPLPCTALQSMYVTAVSRLFCQYWSYLIFYKTIYHNLTQNLIFLLFFYSNNTRCRRLLEICPLPENKPLEIKAFEGQ